MADVANYTVDHSVIDNVDHPLEYCGKCNTKSRDEKYLCNSLDVNITCTGGKINGVTYEYWNVECKRNNYKSEN